MLKKKVTHVHDPSKAYQCVWLTFKPKETHWHEWWYICHSFLNLKVLEMQSSKKKKGNALNREYHLTLELLFSYKW